MKVWILTGQAARDAACQAIRDAPEGYAVKLGEATRSLDQNAMLWPLLEDVSRQVDWYGKKLSPDEWKDVFTAGLKRSKVVPGLDGGFVACGLSSSKMGKAEFSELLELILAFAAERNVNWSA